MFSPLQTLRTKLGLMVMGLGLVATSLVQASEQVYRQALESTVFIVIPQGEGKISFGSGAVVDAQNGTIVTACHVVRGQSQAQVYFPARDQQGRLITDPGYYMQHKDTLSLSGNVLVANEGRDVAVVQVAQVPAGTKAMPLASGSVNPGDTVHAVGNSGYNDGTLWRYSAGLVRQVYRRTITYKSNDGHVQTVTARVVETQVPTNGGDSGGPIVNDRGELVAITSGGQSNESLVEYGIDISEINATLADAHARISPPDTNNPGLDPGRDDDQPLPPRNSRPSARILSVNERYDVMRGDLKGIEIRVQVQVNNSNNGSFEVDAVLADANGNFLRAVDSKLCTPDHQYVAAHTKLPASGSTTQTVTIFLPYNAVLAVDNFAGKRSFQYQINIWSARDKAWIATQPVTKTFDLTISPPADQQPVEPPTDDRD